MSDPTMKTESLSFENVFFVHSEKLRELRAVARGWKDLQKVSGSLMQFRLVVDTNVILGDLLWLVAERKNANAKTQLMETIDAETIQIYAPPMLFIEIEEKIPLLAAKKRIDINALYFHWEIYKAKIKMELPDEKLVVALKDSKDPDDAEFVALAQTIGAKGILSKDGDIAKMGGNSISIECITYLRNYSRSTALELNIKVNGMTFAFLGVMAIKSIIGGMKELIEKIKNAPDWMKLGLIIGGLFIALHPETRARVTTVLSTIFSGVSETTPVVIQAITEIGSLAEKHKKEAQLQLKSALSEIEGTNPI